MYSENKKFALLIDADNAQANSIAAVLTEAARYGDAISRRCYGDWTSPNLKSWKEILNKYAIQPIQQFSYTSGKNATDAALIIDAMDLLYTNKFNGFFLVSSDSDFTKLATRIREAGLEVIGIGRKQTPEPFRVACNKFIFTESIMDEEIPTFDNNAKDSEITLKTSSEIKKGNEVNSLEDKNLKKLIRDAIDLASEDDGWANLGGVGSCIPRIDSSFDARNYGFSKLGKLITSLKYVKVEQRKTENGASNVYVQFLES